VLSYFVFAVTKWRAALRSRGWIPLSAIGKLDKLLPGITHLSSYRQHFDD
jgi:hypothetical protein